MADDWQIFDDLSAKSPAFAGAAERYFAENPGASLHEAVETARAATFGADVVWPERWAVDGDRSELDEPSRSEPLGATTPHTARASRAD